MGVKATVFAIIVIIAAIALVLFGVLHGNLFLYKYFAPKYQKAHRDVWEQTPSRIIGAEQDIAHRYYEFQKTNNSDEKEAICSYLRQAYSDINPDDLRDYTLRQFFRECKYGG